MSHNGSLADFPECFIVKPSKFNRPSDFALPKLASCNSKRSSKYSLNTKLGSFCEQLESDDFDSTKHLSGVEIGSCCDGEFTPSGCDPPKTTGPFNKCFDGKYAPCGHWSTCKAAGCCDKKYFESCETCSSHGKLNYMKESQLTEKKFRSSLWTVRALDEAGTCQVHIAEK